MDILGLPSLWNLAIETKLYKEIKDNRDEIHEKHSRMVY